jgi:hypothetical protein
MRLFLAALAAAVIICASVLVGLEFPALVNAIQRNVKQNWVLGLLLAVIVSSFAAGRFWKFRHYLRVWAVYAAYLLLHFLLAVPLLGRQGTIRSGNTFLYRLASCEVAVILFMLNFVTAPLSYKVK